MISISDIDNLSLLTEEQRETLKALSLKHEAIPYNRKWISSQEVIDITSEYVAPDILDGKKDLWVTNITSDAIIERVFVFKNGILLKTPYPNSGYPWIQKYVEYDYTVEIKSTDSFVPPVEIHLHLNDALVNTDKLSVAIFYRSYIPGDYTFVDAITDLYLKRTRDEKYLDRDYFLFKEYEG